MYAWHADPPCQGLTRFDQLIRKVYTRAGCCVHPLQRLRRHQAATEHREGATRVAQDTHSKLSTTDCANSGL